MVSTEIVNTTNQEHADFQCLGLTSQAAGTPCQASQRLAKGGIEAFNEGSIDLPATLGGCQTGLYPLAIALHNPAFNGQLVDAATLHNLHDVDALPGDQAWTAPLTDPQGGAKGFLEGIDITHQPIHESVK